MVSSNRLQIVSGRFELAHRRMSLPFFGTVVHTAAERNALLPRKLMPNVDLDRHKEGSEDSSMRSTVWTKLG